MSKIVYSVIICPVCLKGRAISNEYNIDTCPYSHGNFKKNKLPLPLFLGNVNSENRRRVFLSAAERRLIENTPLFGRTGDDELDSAAEEYIATNM